MAVREPGHALDGPTVTEPSGPHPCDRTLGERVTKKVGRCHASINGWVGCARAAYEGDRESERGGNAGNQAQARHRTILRGHVLIQLELHVCHVRPSLLEQLHGRTFRELKPRSFPSHSNSIAC